MVLTVTSHGKYRSFGISKRQYKTVQGSTRLMADFWYRYRTVQDGTSRYQIISALYLYRQYLYLYRQYRYKTVQDGTILYQISTHTMRTGWYRTVQVSTRFSKWYILVHTGMYSYRDVPVQTCTTQHTSFDHAPSALLRLCVHLDSCQIRYHRSPSIS